jgi:ATP-binding cassette subfamily C (CFTR/MRP) protein 1
VGDLPALDTKLESRELGEKLTVSWDKCMCDTTIKFEAATDLMLDDHQERHSLLKACLRAYLLSLLSPIVPRVFTTAFTFTQPFLITTTVNFVGEKDHDANYGKVLSAHGVWLTWE